MNTIQTQRQARGSRYFSQWNPNTERWSITKIPPPNELGHRELMDAVNDTADRNIRHQRENPDLFNDTTRFQPYESTLLREIKGCNTRSNTPETR